MKRVLLTGSAGFVGSHFVDHFLEKTDWEIIGLDSFRHRGDSLRINPNKDRYRIFTCDVGAPISDRVAYEIGPVNYVINMASDSHVDRSITDPVPFLQNNVNIAISMLEYARKFRDIEKFIQISTDEVYGPAPEGVNHKEWSPILPSNPYSASKASQEAIGISYWRSYDVPLIITNTMNMFGQRQDKEKFIPLLISKINNGEVVTIHGSEDYIGKRHYLHARNFADGILFLLKDKIPTQYADSLHVTIPDRFNIVGEVELDNLQVAKKVAEILEKPLKYELVDFHRARPGHDRRYALDRSKMDEFGWKQPCNFDESLQKTVEWTLKNPTWMI